MMAIYHKNPSVALIDAAVVEMLRDAQLCRQFELPLSQVHISTYSDIHIE